MERKEGYVLIHRIEKRTQADGVIKHRTLNTHGFYVIWGRGEPESERETDRERDRRMRGVTGSNTTRTHTFYFSLWLQHFPQ